MTPALMPDMPTSPLDAEESVDGRHIGSGDAEVVVAALGAQLVVALDAGGDAVGHGNARRLAESSRVLPDTTVSGSIQALPSPTRGHRRHAGMPLHGALGLRVENAEVDAAVLGLVSGGHGDVQAAHGDGLVAEALAVDIEGPGRGRT